MTDRRILLKAQGLTFSYERPPKHKLPAISAVSLDLATGETVALLGESGSGKSTLGRLAAGLLQPTDGYVHRGENVGVQVVSQDPQATLNPRLHIWDIITESLLIRTGAPRSARIKEASRLADLVGLPQYCLGLFPHQLSGGQRQRVAIARAIAPEPDFLILDEPTSALDVSIQARILNLLMDIQARLECGYLLISHDIEVVRRVADRTLVLYRGKVVESGPTLKVLSAPSHPYTRFLIEASPRLGQRFTGNVLDFVLDEHS